MKYALLIIISVLVSTLITLGLLFNRGLFSQQTNPATVQETDVTAQPNATKTDNLLEQRVEQLEASYAALLKNQNQQTTQTSKNADSEAKTETTTVTKYVTQTTPAKFTNQVIYLGAATTTQRDWTTTGVEVTLNSANYPAGTTIRFEAGLKIIGGEAWARLVNKTTGAIITLTEVSNNTNTTTWKGAPAFQIHSGNNMYAVELRSSSGETAVLDGSRIILE
jgi:uncharacterized protein YxeA